jgi:hypothetical protein
LYFLGIHAENVGVGVSIHNFLPSCSLGLYDYSLRPIFHPGVENPCAIQSSADKATWLVSGWRCRWAPIQLRRSEFERSSWAQAAPDVAAAEEVLVPVDNNILAGPVNRAIAFRG